MLYVLPGFIQVVSLLSEHISYNQLLIAQHHDIDHRWLEIVNQNPDVTISARQDKHNLSLKRLPFSIEEGYYINLEHACNRHSRKDEARLLPAATHKWSLVSADPVPVR